MKFDLTKNSAVSMAKTLRTLAPGMTHSFALEAVSKMFGHPNWDTLSALLKSEVTPELNEKMPTLHAPVTFFLSACATGDTHCHGPDHAKVLLSQELLDHIHQMQTNVIQARMSMEASMDWPVDWGDADDVLRLGVPRLIVDKDSFYFVAYPRHDNFSVETCLVSIVDLKSALDRELGGNAQLDFADNVLFADSNSAQEFARSLLDQGNIDVNEGCIDKMAA